VVSVASADPEPRFRRPVPGDAVDVARERVDAGERIDVLAVARRLGVSRATMHRWFGTRDQLVAAVLDRLSEDLVAAAIQATRGTGDERVYDFTRHLAAAAGALAPLRATAEREPGLVVQLMLAAGGPVRPRVLDAVRGMLAEGRTPAQVRRLEPVIETYVDAATALQWALLAAGRDPDPERYVAIGRALFTAAEAPSPER